MPYIKDSWGSGSLRQKKSNQGKKRPSAGQVVPGPLPAHLKKAKRIVNQPMDNA